jgi:PilZ domain
MFVEKSVRRHRRIPYSGPIRIAWETSGQAQFAIGKCVDVSEEGLLIESTQQVQPGVVILLNAERIKVAGSATVKHTMRRGGKYRIGLKLSQAVLAKTIEKLESSPEVTVIIENLNRIH